MASAYRWCATYVFLSCGLSALWARNGTHTGNPGQGGADFVRSSLKHDDHPDASADQRTQLANGNQEFAFDLYAELASQHGDDNLLMAPYSISVGLAMTYAGTAGDTKSEMKTAGHLDLPEPDLHAAFNAVGRELEARSAPTTTIMGKDVEGARVSIANAAFAKKGTDFERDYLDVLALNYDAGMYRLDFAGDPEKARASINDWVADETEQRIKDLLPKRSIDARTEIVLVDAVYFSANWLSPFDKDRTDHATFHAPSGDVMVSMMHRAESSRYAEGDGYQAVELPFAPSELRMLFILPAEGRFGEIEAGLDRSWLAGVQQAMSLTQVVLGVPRFEFDSVFDLATNLEALGIQRAFGPDADFSRMSAESIRISTVQHKTFIAVDEVGVEAAAAVAYVGTAGTTPPPAVVTLDRPFLFLIYDQPTNQVLFLGRLENPR